MIILTKKIFFNFLNQLITDSISYIIPNFSCPASLFSDKDRFWIQIFIKLIIYEHNIKMEREKIHISCKFKKCMVFISSFILIFFKINLSILGMNHMTAKKFVGATGLGFCKCPFLPALVCLIIGHVCIRL